MFVEPLDTSFLDAGGDCQRALAWYRRFDGRMDIGGQDEGLVDVMQRGHASMIRAPEIPPVLFWIGPKSPAAATFGDDWAAEAIGAEGIPDADAERLCNAAYYDAFARGKPVTHLCRAGFKVDGSRTVELFYSRLLLPLYRRQRAPLILCVADLISLDS